MVTHPPGLIGMLTRPTGFTATWPCVIQMTKPSGTKHAVMSGTSIAMQRNVVVRAFYKSPELEWLLFIDDDQVFPPDALIRLLDHNVDIVGTVIAGKYAPFQPWVFFEDANAPGGYRRAENHEVKSERGLTEVAGVGVGFWLIRKRVLDAFEDPWFKCGQINPELVGEDVLFSIEARQKGFKVHVDMGLKVGHLTVMNVILNDEGQPMLTHERFMRRQVVV